MAHRILVLRLSSLGDVVLTAPVYRNIKAHWPDAHICVLVKPPFLPVLENNPYVDEVIPFIGLKHAVREIRRRGFTHLLDLHATLRTFLIRTLCGIPNVAVYRKDAVARRLYVLFRWASPALTRHSLDRYLESLKAWGVPIRFRTLSLGDYGSKGGRSRKQPASRVLLLQTSFLGDTLLTLPLAKKIKEVLPGCHLTVLTRPQTADIFRRGREIDAVIEDDKRGRDSGLGGLWRLSRRLNAGKFDLALVAHRSLRSALAVWLAGISHRIGFSTSAGSFLFHDTVYFPWGMPELERNLALLLPLKPDLKTDSSDSLFLSRQQESNPSAAAAIKQRLRASGVRDGDRVVGVHPGSVWPTKRWLPARFAALCGRLARDAGVRIILIGGGGDRELCRGIAERSGADIIDWSGRTTLAELLALAPHLKLFITNDSGPMHIAAAHGVPTIALFGPTTRELGFFPYGEGHRVLEAELGCRPCGLHGRRACPEGHFLCMRLITAGEVFRSAADMLDRKTVEEPA
ncbi:MAG: glycosyltransferase family 9 protein [Elusimicrobiota bacterium]